LTDTSEWDSRIKAIVEYWRSLSSDDCLPRRKQFDPVSIPQLLPHIYLVDIHRDPLQFQLRLIGTRVVEFHGKDHTGRWLNDVFPHFEKTETCADMEAVANSGTIRYWKGKPRLNFEKDFAALERVFLPMVDTGKEVGTILGMTLFHLGRR